MPIYGTIYWGDKNPLRDPGFARLPELFEALRTTGGPPQGWVGGSIYQNSNGALPERPHGHYREYDCGPPGEAGRDGYRVVVGRSGEVYTTSNHYTDNWLQIFRAPIF